MGHNPLGGYAVLALLGALTLQGVTGLFSADDVVTEGPLYGVLGTTVSDILTVVHEEAFWLLLVPMIVVHITAIAAYWRFKRVNLVKPMVTGYKD